MASTPQYADTVNLDSAAISTANTNRDGTGTLGDVFTAGSSGSRVDWIIIQATGTTTAGIVRLFIYDGANTRLFDEIGVQAATPSGTVLAFSRKITFENGLILPASHVLKAGTHKAEDFNVIASGGNF